MKKTILTCSIYIYIYIAIIHINKSWKSDVFALIAPSAGESEELHAVFMLKYNTKILVRMMWSVSLKHPQTAV